MPSRCWARRSGSRAADGLGLVPAAPGRRADRRWPRTASAPGGPSPSHSPGWLSAMHCWRIAVPSPAWLPIIYANFFASFFAAFALRGGLLRAAGRNPNAAPPDRRNRGSRVVYRFYAGNLLRADCRPHPRPGARTGGAPALFHVSRRHCAWRACGHRLAAPAAAKRRVFTALCTVIWVNVQSGWQPYSHTQESRYGGRMRPFTIAIFTLSLALSGPVAGADVDELLAQCEDCHGSGGISSDSDVPTIAGQNAYLYRENAAFVPGLGPPLHQKQFPPWRHFAPENRHVPGGRRPHQRRHQGAERSTTARNPSRRPTSRSTPTWPPGAPHCISSVASNATSRAGRFRTAAPGWPANGHLISARP